MENLVLSNFKKDKLITSLEKSGFKVLLGKKEILSLKDEHILIINSFGEIEHKIDFTKVFSKINYEKDISGIPQLELKKLLKEEKKTNQFLFDTFLYVINKLNWSQRFHADVPLFENQNMKIVEFYGEGNDVYNFIFLQQEENEYMFMTQKSRKEIFDIVEKTMEIQISDLCPDLIDYL